MSQTAPAYAGSPARFPPARVFDWLFSNPFATDSSFAPVQNRIAKVEDGRPVFIDEATGKLTPN